MLTLLKHKHMYAHAYVLRVLIGLLCTVACIVRPVYVSAEEKKSEQEKVIEKYKEDIKNAIEEEQAHGIEHDNANNEVNNTNVESLEQGAVSKNKSDEIEKVNSETENNSLVQTNDNEESNNSDAEQELHFNIWEYRVEGNSLLSKEQIERSVYPFLGPDKTINTVEFARTTLEQAYNDNGYGTVFVDIPEQDVEDGVVTLNVTERKVGRVKITGSRYYSLGKIRKEVPALAEGFTPHMPDVQKQVADLNKGVAGRTVTPIMKPGDTPGKVDVELKVQDKFPIHGSLSLDDRYTSNTNRLRLNANMSYDNLWQKYHSASIGYVVAPQDRSEVEVIYGTYVIPTKDYLIALYAVNSSSDVASTGDINQIGAGKIFGLRTIVPLPAIGNYSHRLTIGSDYKDFEETTSLLGVDALNTPASYLTFNTEYAGDWYHEKGKTSFSFDAHIAPRGLGNTNKEFENKRAGAKPNFAYLKGSFEHQRRFIYNSMLNIRLDAQVSDSPLISNEQFSAGGADTVRGYLESQQLGDYGLIGSMEIHTPSFAKYVADYFNDLHLFTFVDAARLKIIDPLADQLSDFTLASVGFGMELNAFDGFNAEMLWATVLRDNDTIHSGDSRFHFDFGYKF